MKRRTLRLLINTACAVLTAAAAVTAPCGQTTPGRQVTVAPRQVTYGKAARVTLHLPAGMDGAHVALAPWQPDIRAALPLERPGYTVAAAGNTVVVAGKGGVTLVDAAGAAPTVLGRFSTDDTCTRVRVQRDTVYASCRHSGLWLIDISEPAAPRRLARLHLAPVTDVAVNRGRLFVLSGQNVITYDVSSPAAPVEVGRHTLSGPPAHALAVRGETLFIAQGRRGLVAFHVTAAGLFQERGRYRTTGPAVEIAVRDGLAYLALNNAGVVVLDVTHPAGMRWIGSYHRLGQVRRLIVSDHGLYLATAAGTLFRMDDHRPSRLTIAAARHFTRDLRSFAVGGGGRVWALTANALELTDFSRSVPEYSNETFDVGEGVNFGGIRRGVVRGNIVYVADWFSGIHLFDVSDPNRPQLISSLHIPGSPKGIALRNGYAVVADDDHGVQIIDISDPSRPRRVAHLQTPGLGYTPYLVGDRLYLASHRGGFQIIDISHIRHPQLLTSYATPGKAWSIQVKDGIAYVADDAAGLLLFDVRDARHVRPVAAFDPGGYAEDVVLHNGYALVTFFDRGLYILDVRDPRHPRQVAHLATPGNARGIEVRGDKAYIADWLAGVHIIDISDLQEPHILGSYDTDGAAWGIRVKGRYAYVMDWWGGFTVLDVSDPARPRLAAHYHDRGRVRQIIARDKFIFTAYGRGGLQVFDVKNPLNPIWVTGLDVRGQAAALWLHPPYLYLASDGGGLTVVDASNPYDLKPLGRLPAEVTHPIIVGDGRGSVYLYDRGSGIRVIDVSHPRDPRRSALIPVRANALWYGNRTLYVATPQGGVRGYDVSNPRQPEPDTVLPADGPVTAVTGKGAAVYFAVAGSGVYGFKRQGKNWRRTALFKLPEHVGDLTVVGSDLFAAQTRGGVWDLAIGRDGGLSATAFYPILHSTTRLSAHGGTVYVAGGTTPTAVAWFPGLGVTAPDAGAAALSLPGDLPRGSYDVMLLTKDGGRYVTPGAFDVRLPPKNAHPFTMGDFKKALKKWRATHPLSGAKN